MDSPLLTQRELYASAALTLHEFLLEIAFANRFCQSGNPSAAFDTFRTDLMDRIQYKMRVRDSSGEQSLIAQKMVGKLAETFCTEVAARMEDLQQE